MLLTLLLKIGRDLIPTYRHKTLPTPKEYSFLGGIHMDIRHPPNTLHDNHHVGFVHMHPNVVLEDNTHMQVHACIISESVFFSILSSM